MAVTSADTAAQHVGQQAFEPNPDFLESAKGAAQWIESAQKQDARGVYWFPEPDHPEKATTVSAANAIYSGSAGTVLFFIQLVNATGETRHLDTASLGADYLVATWRDLVDKPGEGLLSGPGLNLAFYGDGSIPLCFPRPLTEPGATSAATRFPVRALAMWIFPS